MRGSNSLHTLQKSRAANNIPSSPPAAKPKSPPPQNHAVAPFGRKWSWKQFKLAFYDKCVIVIGGVKFTLVGREVLDGRGTQFDELNLEYPTPSIYDSLRHDFDKRLTRVCMIDHVTMTNIILYSGKRSPGISIDIGGHI
jgi:hypothetical protein